MADTPGTFGECLTKVLDDNQWTAPQLALALSIERSLIYKWRRGERTPRLGSGYAARMVELLKLSPEEQATLEESQLQSLRAPRVPRPAKQRMRGDVQRLLDMTPTFEPLPFDTTDVDGAAPKVGTSVTHGRMDALLAAMELIDKAPPPGDPTDHAAYTILITSLEWGSGNESAMHDIAQRWYTVASRAIARGWHFHHLMRLDKDTRRSLAMARMVLDLMGTGRYSAVYFYASELLLPACELALIPGVAAIQFFATQAPHSVDAAMIVEDSQQIAVLQEYYQQMAFKAKPLLQIFSHQDWVALEQLRAEVEERYGARVIVKDGLSRVTEPPSWTNPDSQRGASLWPHPRGLVGVS